MKRDEDDDDRPIRLTVEEANALRDELFLFVLPDAFFSSLSLVQLRDLRDERIVNTHVIADEIRALEGRSGSRGTKDTSAIER